MNVFDQLSDSYRRKPVKTLALLFAGGVAFMILREFTLGFIDGLVAAFNDGV